MPDFLADLPHPIRIQLPVQWGDMDAFQHVNNTVYFRYFESARIAYFAEMGIIKEPVTIGPILAKTHCTFVAPLRFPDEVICTASVVEVQRDRFSMDYHVYSASRQQIAAKGGGLVVSYDYRSNTKVDLPEHWRAAIERLESR